MNISLNDISDMIFNCIENKNKYPLEKLKLTLSLLLAPPSQ